jgi:type VI protein secretion system component VasF
MSNANDLRYSAEYVATLQAEIERLRDQDAETLKAHLELAFEVQRLQQAEADELIKKMRSEIERLRERLDWLDVGADKEIERLRWLLREAFDGGMSSDWYVRAKEALKDE